MTTETNTRRIVRLWWHCNHCAWKVDTFGKAHTDPNDLSAAGDEALGHLYDAHGITPATYSDAAANLSPGHATTRVVRHDVIVAR